MINKHFKLGVCIAILACFMILCMVGCDNAGDKTPAGPPPGWQDNGDGNPNDNDDEVPDGGSSNQLFRVDFSELSSWVDGYNAEITLTNKTGQIVDGWTLECNTPYTISSAWNSTWSKVSPIDRFINLPWNSELKPNGSVKFNFGATGTFVKSSDFSCSCNGEPALVTFPDTNNGGNNNGSGSDIRIPDEDPAESVLPMITIDQGLSVFTLESKGAAVFSLSTNNRDVIDFSMDNINDLKLTGKQAGRASLKIETDTGKVRYLGIRVKTNTGEIPGLPDYLSVGSVSEDSTGDLDFWKNFSDDGKNKRMDIRYIYLNGGPYLGWTTWNGTVNQKGGRAISYIRESMKLGMLSAFVYYNIPDGGESYYTDVKHMQDATYMEDYFKDLNFAIDIINKEAGDEPVIIILEPDFLGYLSQNADNPAVMMAKTSSAYTSGVLTGNDPVFPDTVRGLVEAINYTIASKAPHVIFGWQLNLWASPQGGFTNSVPGNGLIHLTDTKGLNAGRQMIYDESAADDPASSTWFWNSDHWNNYLHFVKAMKDTSQLPVVLWQLPVGHINSSTLNNPYNNGLFPDLANTSTRYEDSAPVFFLGDRFTRQQQSP